jgi:lipopolysaccharide transport system permease protein
MKQIEEIVTTYEPDNSLKSGYFMALRNICREFIENHWLIQQLFWRDFSAIYKQSLIGFLWIFIMPIINVAIFAMLGNSGILNFGEITVPYPVFAMLGVSLWQIFANGVTACGNALTSAGDMIIRISFSRKSLVLAAMGRGIVTFLIQLLLIAILFIVYRVVPSKGVILLPLFALPIVFLTLGLGFVIAILNAIIRDTGNLLGVVVMLGMYATPILYDKPKIGLLATITNYNPMYYLISSGRDMALTGTLSEPVGFILSCVFAILVFFFGLFTFHLTETRISERI